MADSLYIVAVGVDCKRPVIGRMAAQAQARLPDWGAARRPLASDSGGLARDRSGHFGRKLPAQPADDLTQIEMGHLLVVVRHGGLSDLLAIVG